MSKRSLSFLAALLFWVAASPALATTVEVQVGGGDAVDVTGLGATVSDEESGVTFWMLMQDGELVDPNNKYLGIAGVEITGMNAALKEDPFVTNNISFINPTGVTQTYTVTVTLTIPSFNYNATVASSVGVTVTNTTGPSVSAKSVTPDGIYSGQVNGVTILTLLADPTDVTCAGSGCSTTVSDNTALPLLPAGPGTATSIGIQLKFDLSAGDQVGITSRFEIVPEPAGMALLGIGLVTLAVGRRRAA